MSIKVEILLTIFVLVTTSIIRISAEEFTPEFNSSFLNGSDRVFKPIVIPNITGYSENVKAKIHETQRTKENEAVLQKILNPPVASEESTIKENFLEDQSKTTVNPIKFSSRYSTKLEDEGTAQSEESKNQTEEEIPEPLEIKKSEVLTKSEVSGNDIHKLFSDRSDYLSDSEEREDKYKDVTEEEESDTAEPSSFKRYSDEDHNSTSEDHSEEEEDVTDKKSVKDYHNSDSKNYKSVQTPLEYIKYRGVLHHDQPRSRLISPFKRRPINWPYSKLNENHEKLNEISDNVLTYEKDLDDEVKEEVKSKPSHLELEDAIKKDEFKFNRNKKYNQTEQKIRRKQHQKKLAAAEAKDDSKPLFPNFKQYQVKEKEPNYQANEYDIEKIQNAWSTEKSSALRKPKKFNELSSEFQGHQFLGPVVFNQSKDQQKIKPVEIKNSKQPVRSSYIKGLLQNEKIDQNTLSNQKAQSAVFENLSSQSFNHLEESHEMYNSILANIQSVFGSKSQPLKASGGLKSVSAINLDESKAFTWSLPPTTKRP